MLYCKKKNFHLTLLSLQKNLAIYQSIKVDAQNSHVFHVENVGVGDFRCFCTAAVGNYSYIIIITHGVCSSSTDAVWILGSAYNHIFDFKTSQN